MATVCGRKERHAPDPLPTPPSLQGVLGVHRMCLFCHKMSSPIASWPTTAVGWLRTAVGRPTIAIGWPTTTGGWPM